MINLNIFYERTHSGFMRLYSFFVLNNMWYVLETFNDNPFDSVQFLIFNQFRMHGQYEGNAITI